MANVDKKIVVTAALVGALTIAIGAFGAHGLKKLVDAQAVASFETGVRYQMYHAIVLLIVGWMGNLSKATKIWVFRLFLAGIVLFSGSIYLLTLDETVGFDAGSIGFVTPLGGLLFIVGWVVLALGALRKN